MALHGLHSPLFLMAASSSASLEQGKLRAECTGRRDAGDGSAGICCDPEIPTPQIPASSGIRPARPPALRSHGSGQVRQPAARGETSAPEMHAMVRLRPNLSTSWSSIPFITVIGQSEPYPRAKTTGSNKSGYFSFYLPQKIARPSYKHHLQSRSRLHLSAYRALPAAMVSDLLAWLGLKCQLRR